MQAHKCKEWAQPLSLLEGTAVAQGSQGIAGGAVLTGGQDLLEIRVTLQDAREGCSWGAPRPQLLPYRPFMGAGVQGKPLTDRALELVWLHCASHPERKDI